MVNAIDAGKVYPQQTIIALGCVNAAGNGQVSVCCVCFAVQVAIHRCPRIAAAKVDKPQHVLIAIFKVRRCDGRNRTIDVVREGDGMLYKEALEKFWKNFEEKFGSIEGRDLALVNVRYDADAMNFFGLYTRPKVSIRADVIEYLDE